MLAMAPKPYRVAFGHGCNCFCAMGKGIALEVKQKLPALAAVDASTPKGDRTKIGSFTSAEFDWGVGYNLYTQYTWNNPKDMVDWRGVEVCLERLFTDMCDRGLHVLVMPKICSGLARGMLSEEEAWGRVVHIVEKVCPQTAHVVVVEFDPAAASRAMAHREGLWASTVPNTVAPPAASPSSSTPSSPAI